MAKAATPKRGDVWTVNFDPTIGAEIGKARPAVVIGVESIGRLPLQLVVPITDWKPAYSSYPWFVELIPNATNGLSKPSGADAFQVKSVSEARFVRHMGRVSDDQVLEIAEAIALCVGAP